VHWQVPTGLLIAPDIVGLATGGLVGTSWEDGTADAESKSVAVGASDEIAVFSEDGMSDNVRDGTSESISKATDGC
jgi:hypothetical protein